MDCKRTSQTLSYLVLALGGLVLAGWIFDLEVLKRVHPALVTMKANTAVCFILLAAGTLIATRESTPSRLLFLRFCALITAVVAALTLAEHLFHWDAGIDQFLFRESTAEAGQSFPGRMGPASTVIFILLSAALLGLDVRTKGGRCFSNLCVLLALLNTFLISLAYFYGLALQSWLAVYASIALHTVFAFVLLCVAIPLTRPKCGIAASLLGNQVGAIAARRMLPIAVIAPVFLGWLLVTGAKSGWFQLASGAAICMTAVIIVFGLMIWRTVIDLERVAAAQYRLAAIVESSDDPILSKTTEGIITSWNASAERLFGYTAAEIVGQPITRIIPADRLDEEKMILERLQAGESIAHYETVRLKKNGSVVDVSLTISPVRDSQDRIVGASKIIRDITERKRAQAALEEERQWLAVTLASIGDAVIATDRDGRVKFLNSVAEEMTGWAAKDAIGKPVGEVFVIVHEKTREPAQNPVERALREGIVVGLANHTALLSRDGSEKSIEDSAAPIRDAQGIPLGAVMVFHDVTNRRHAEEAVRIARDAAESANRAKDEFLAALSHELRTPLTPVLMVAAELENAEDVPERFRHDFAMIRKNVELEARLIDDLLDLTRITRGKLTLRFEVVNAHALITHAFEMLRGEIEAKRLTVTLDLEAPEHMVSADSVRLQQVLWNVVKNAVKFTGEDGQILVRSWDEDCELRLSFSDTGLGITTEEMPHIFDAFAQGQEAAQSRFGGLGLGLSISSLLVREHGGKIWAESPGRNQGATFHLRLPLASTSLAPGPNGTSSPPMTGRRLNILLVEDHEASRQTLSRLLERRGHRVETAVSVSSAREVASRGEFDIVVSDLGLPDGDGHDLMRTLKRDFGLTGIALSGYGMESDLSRSRDAGFAEHFTKPVDIAALESAMHRALVDSEDRDGDPLPGHSAE